MQPPDAVPHVRWCGSPDGRNPVRATRSSEGHPRRRSVPHQLHFFGGEAVGLVDEVAEGAGVRMIGLFHSGFFRAISGACGAHSVRYEAFHHEVAGGQVHVFFELLESFARRDRELEGNRLLGIGLRRQTGPAQNLRCLARPDQARMSQIDLAPAIKLAEVSPSSSTP
jgi:hypothetical protein